MAFNKAKALQEAEKSLAQGKVSQAIKQYLQIFEKDPSDLSLLNTIGDLYVRDKNVPEALKQFHKLAESYSKEGFTVKAIAILRKVSKLDPGAVEVLLKMGELYTIQGLGREAREQYAAAVEFYKKKNQNDKALEAFRKIVSLDPENAVYRAKLAEFCEQMGKKSEAAEVYREAVEAALRKGDLGAAGTALSKAASLDAKNPQNKVLRARLALSQNKPGEVETILGSVPELKSDPAVRKLLLESYLASHQVDKAEKLVVDVFHSNPEDFTPLANFARLCIEKGDFDAAVIPLAQVADTLIQQKNTSELSEVLREVWAKRSNHLPTLELIYKTAEKTADESTLPEVLQALGHAYVQAGKLDRAEWAFKKLVDREPENEDYKAMLNQVLQKAGKEVAVASPAELSSVEMALTAEPDVGAAGGAKAPAESAEEAAMVKDALENSDLFYRYNLVDKAIAELEKVLAVYPDQVDVHKRILELSQKSQPGRAAQAAQDLGRIYLERGDRASAKRYDAMARGGAVKIPAAPAVAAGPSGPPAPEPPQAPPPAAPPQPAVAEFDLSAEFSGAAPVEAPASPPPGLQEIPLDLGSAETPPAAAAAAEEVDLSGALEFAAAPVEAPPVAGPRLFNYEESRVEVDFYLEQGFFEEAQKAIQALEEKFPGDLKVAELRRHFQTRAAVARKGEEVAAAPETPAAAEWELPSTFAETPPSEPPAVEMPPAAQPPAPAEAAAAPPPPPQPAPQAAGGDLLGSLVGDLESSLEGLEEKIPAGGVQQRVAPQPPLAGASGSGASPLSGLLEELGEAEGAQAAAEDPQTHYDLGVAFREMNLLDEAIGEFQKVVKGVQKGKVPANFLQACTLLALCFMDKKMPAIAAKWYARALEIPNLDEEATLALLYDLGVAFEQAGDPRTALEKFSEVYSQNIDYRDVAEKIRTLQQKG